MEFVEEDARESRMMRAPVSCEKERALDDRDLVAFHFRG